MRGDAFRFYDFRDGLNTNDGVYVVSDGEARDCLNVVGTSRGSIKKRDGNVVFANAPSSSSFLSVFGFETTYSSNPTKWLIASHGTATASLWSINNAGNTLTQIKSGFTGGQSWQFCQFPSSNVPGAAGYAFGMNGIDTPQYVYQSGVSSLTSTNWVGSGSAATNALASSGATTLQFASVPPFFAIGATVTGSASIPTGTLITAVTSTTITLSAPLTNSIASGTSITATNGGSVPNGEFVVQWQGRLWAAGVSGFGSRLYYSDIANAWSWPSTNTADFDAADGEEITGLGTCGPYLLVFKRSKIWAIYDVDTTLGPLNRVVSRNIGACSHKTIVETPSGTLFLTPDKGVWATDGSNVSDLSLKVRPSFQMDTSLEQGACAAYINNHYYVSFPSTSDGASGNDVTLDYDFALKSWWKHSCASAEFTVWRNSASGALQLYGVRAAVQAGGAGTPSTTPGIDRFFAASQSTDNGYSFPVYWISGWHEFTPPQVKKRLRRIVFDGAGTFNALLSTDFSLGWQLYGTLNLSELLGSTFGVNNGYVFGDTTDPVPFGGSSTALFSSVYGIGGDISGTGKTGVGRTMSVKFEGNANNDFKMNGYTMLVKPRKN